MPSLARVRRDVNDRAPADLVAEVLSILEPLPPADGRQVQDRGAVARTPPRPGVSPG
jgi:hypothetical protein